MKLRTYYYQQFDADYSLEVPAEGYGGWRETKVEISPAHTAVVLMHACDLGTLEEYPGRFRACQFIPRSYQICRDVLPGLLTAVRQSGMPLFHVAGGDSDCASYPGYQRAVMLAGPDPAPVPWVTADPIYRQLRQFRTDEVFPGKHNVDDVNRGESTVAFPKEAEPLGDEGIAKDTRQLAALALDTGVNHLIYAGFNIDWCLLMSEGGMVDMSRRGFICSAFQAGGDGGREQGERPAGAQQRKRPLARVGGVWVCV